MSVDTLIRKALDSGVELALIDGVVKVIGHRTSVNQWRDQLRAHKAEIYQHLSAANDPEPPLDRAQWLEIDREYQRHHFNCRTCQAAGRGAMYGVRCGVGASLWTTYANRSTIN